MALARTMKFAVDTLSRLKALRQALIVHGSGEGDALYFAWGEVRTEMV